MQLFLQELWLTDGMSMGGCQQFEMSLGTAAACNCCFSVIAAVGLLFALWGVFEEKITNSGLMRSEIAGNNAPPSNRELFFLSEAKIHSQKGFAGIIF